MNTRQATTSLEALRILYVGEVTARREFQQELGSVDFTESVEMYGVGNTSLPAIWPELLEKRPHVVVIDGFFDRFYGDRARDDSEFVMASIRGRLNYLLKPRPLLFYVEQGVRGSGISDQRLATLEASRLKKPFYMTDIQLAFLAHREIVLSWL